MRICMYAGPQVRALNQYVTLQNLMKPYLPKGKKKKDNFPTVISGRYIMNVKWIQTYAVLNHYVYVFLFQNSFISYCKSATMY